MKREYECLICFNQHNDVPNMKCSHFICPPCYVKLRRQNKTECCFCFKKMRRASL